MLIDDMIHRLWGQYYDLMNQKSFEGNVYLIIKINILSYFRNVTKKIIFKTISRVSYFPKNSKLSFQNVYLNVYIFIWC